jgi:hypothetical protein
MSVELIEDNVKQDEHPVDGPVASVDICLNRVATHIEFDPMASSLDIEWHRSCPAIGFAREMVPVVLEHRAWECPWCKTATEYWLLNDSVIIGCGGSSLHANGKVSNACASRACRDKQRKWHGLEANRYEPLKDIE